MTKAMKAYLASIGSEGGKIGGKSKSRAKLKAIRANLVEAREKRWPKRRV